MTIETRSAYDVDLEKLANLYRELADDIENGDTPVLSFETTREVDADDDVKLVFTTKVLEWSDTDLYEQSVDIFEDG